MEVKVFNVGMLLLLVFFLASCNLHRSLSESVGYTTWDGKYEVYEEGNYVEAYERPISPHSFAIKGKWDDLPHELRQSILETRFHKLDRTLR